MTASSDEMTPLTEPSKTPSQTLAEFIVHKLVAEKLVTESDGKALIPKLAAGKMKAEDWRLAVEKGVAKVSKP